MRGGHNRRPAAVHRLSGSYRRDRHGNPGPAESSEVPAPPRGMSARERAIWTQLAAEVEVRGTFDQACGMAFRLMVKAVALAEDPPKNTASSALARFHSNARAALASFGLRSGREGEGGGATSARRAP